MEDKLAVFYSFKNFNKYNGTLFYCFEYYCFAKKINPKVVFYITHISKKELEEVKAVFRNKYHFDHSYLNDIELIKNIKILYALKLKSSLILDMHTFNLIYFFLRSNIYCYSNVTHEMKRSDFKNIKYFGHYSYQRFDCDVRLKLNFEIFKPISKSNPCGIFVGSRQDDYTAFKLPQELSHLVPINKDRNAHYENLYELFDTVFYYHSALDTNNRLIPESFFYNKKIHIKYNGYLQDSIFFRYEDISINGLDNYTLDESDLMLKSVLEGVG